MPSDVEIILRGRDLASPAVNSLKQSVQGAQDSAAKANSSFSVLGSTIVKFVSAAAVVKFAHDTITAFAEQELATRRLNAALEASGQMSAANSQALVGLAGAMQSTTRYADDTVLSMESLLLSLTGSAEQTAKLTPVVADMASALGVDLETAATAVAKAIQGNAGALQRYGIQVEDIADPTERFNSILGSINEKFGGAAQAQVGTYAGQMDQLKNSFSDFQEILGERFAISITAILGLFGEMPGEFATTFQRMMVHVDDFTQRVMAAISGMTSLISHPFSLEEVKKNTAAILKVIEAETSSKLAKLDIQASLDKDKLAEMVDDLHDVAESGAEAGAAAMSAKIPAFINELEGGVTKANIGEAILDVKGLAEKLGVSLAKLPKLELFKPEQIQQLRDSLLAIEKERADAAKERQEAEKKAQADLIEAEKKAKDDAFEAEKQRVSNISAIISGFASGNATAFLQTLATTIGPMLGPEGAVGGQLVASALGLLDALADPDFVKKFGDSLITGLMAGIANLPLFFADMVTILPEKIGEAIPGMVVKFVENLITALSNPTVWVAIFYGVVPAFAKGLMKGIKEVFSKEGAFTLMWSKSDIDEFMHAPVRFIEEGIRDGFARGMTAFTRSDMSPITKQIGESISEASLNGFREGGRRLRQSIIDGARGMIQRLNSWLSDLPGAIALGGQRAAAAIYSGFAAAPDAIAAGFSRGTAEMLAGFTHGFQEFSNVFGDILDGFSVDFANILNAFPNKLKDALQSVVPGGGGGGTVGQITQALGFQGGTSFVPRTGPALLHRGESVKTARETRQGSRNFPARGGAATVVVVQSSTNLRSLQARLNVDGRQIDQIGRQLRSRGWTK